MYFFKSSHAFDCTLRLHSGPRTWTNWPHWQTLRKRQTSAVHTRYLAVQLHEKDNVREAEAGNCPNLHPTSQPAVHSSSTTLDKHHSPDASQPNTPSFQPFRNDTATKVVDKRGVVINLNVSNQSERKGSVRCCCSCARMVCVVMVINITNYPYRPQITREVQL